MSQTGINSPLSTIAISPITNVVGTGITVSVDNSGDSDIEDLLSGNYWQSKKYDYTTGELDYSGFHKESNATDADGGWEIKKYTWLDGNCVKIQGPLIGSWTGRTLLNW